MLVSLQLQSTKCTVDIVTPDSEHVTFTTDEPQTDLLHVETQKDMQAACGSFTLTFAPTLDERGRTWDERIPMRSLVTITMERPDEPEMPDVDATVMLGITDTHAHTEEWRGPHPQRQVSIQGREISCVMLDAELWYHQALEGQPGTINAQVAAAGLEGLRLAWQPDLAGAGEDPRDILAVILQYFLLGGNTTSAKEKVAPAQLSSMKQEAVINLRFPERSLDTLLVLNRDAWTLFEEGVTVAIANNHPYIGSIWNYLHIYIDEAFQEFFSRVEDGVCKLHFRSKPFKPTKVTDGSRFAEDVATMQTLPLRPEAVLTMALAKQSSSVYNVFWVQPMGMQQFLDSTGVKFLLPPVMVTDPQHSSFVGRYGLRIMNVGSPYIPALQPSVPTPGGPQSGVTPKAASPAKPQVSSTALTPLPTIDPASLPKSVRIPGETLNPTQQYYASLAAKIARDEGVPESMVPSFLANIHQESQFNPDAKSPTGVVGMAQVTLKTGEKYGQVNRNDPVQSLTAGARYWRDLTKKFGPNPKQVAGAYNGGEGAVNASTGAIAPGEPTKHANAVLSKTPSYQANATPSAAPVTTANVSPQPRAAAFPSGTPAAAPAPENAVNLGAITTTARRWAEYLEAWYDSGALLTVGTVTVKGHPAYNVGHRLVAEDDQGEREFYIEGVGHRYDMRTGYYVSSLRVTRGWYTTEREARVAPAQPNADLLAGEIVQTALVGE